VLARWQRRGAIGAQARRAELEQVLAAAAELQITSAEPVPAARSLMKRW
jgi:hypothetical protein